MQCYDCESDVEKLFKDDRDGEKWRCGPCYADSHAQDRLPARYKSKPSNHVRGKVPEDAVEINILNNGEWSKGQPGDECDGASYTQSVHVSDSRSVLAAMALGPNCHCGKDCPMDHAMDKTSKRYGVANERHFDESDT